MSADFICWDDGTPHVPPLADILRTRPGAWAVVAKHVGGHEVQYRVNCVDLDADEGFEVRALPVDDGERGVIYEVQARLLDESGRTDTET